MSTRCFSSSQLYALRNEINVEMLIEKTLQIPCRVTDGCFRFLCPLCNGFDTAVNPKTNLARCFRCEKNYNTIDLVMLTRQADFLYSVKFLQTIHAKDDQGRNNHDPMTKSGSTHKDGDRMKLKIPSGKKPQLIGEILHGVVQPPANGGISEKCRKVSKDNTPMAADQLTVEDRIVKLEKQLKCLDGEIKKIARALEVGLASK